MNAQPETTAAVGSVSRSTTENSLLLPGLDGTNPLGFLAALGVLRTLTVPDDEDRATMSWTRFGGTWSPRIMGCGSDIESLLERLQTALNASDAEPWTLDSKLPFPAETLKAACVEALSLSSIHQRDRADTLASFGVECLRDDKGNFSDTSLRMVRSGDSAGNGLTAYGQRIRNETTIEDLRRALLEIWCYDDEGCALRWAPAENNAYALQWNNPSGEKATSVRGGNRLALAAMPMLPVVPGKHKAATTGFSRPEGRTECLTWPLWDQPASLPVVQSLLLLEELQQQQPSAKEIQARGITAVYRTDRVMTSTYYRNFTPARRIA
ncbi:MAG: hypothetical protein KDA79_08570 [Planctomycetaceae bacterium]|nr:hypothetical protein [Planctomycetaceae bacterium]